MLQLAERQRTVCHILSTMIKCFKLVTGA